MKLVIIILFIIVLVMASCARNEMVTLKESTLSYDWLLPLIEIEGFYDFKGLKDIDTGAISFSYQSGLIGEDLYVELLQRADSYNWQVEKLGKNKLYMYKLIKEDAKEEKEVSVEVKIDPKTDRIYYKSRFINVIGDR